MRALVVVGLVLVLASAAAWAQDLFDPINLPCVASNAPNNFTVFNVLPQSPTLRADLGIYFGNIIEGASWVSSFSYKLFGNATLISASAVVLDKFLQPYSSPLDITTATTKALSSSSPVEVTATFDEPVILDPHSPYLLAFYVIYENATSTKTSYKLSDQKNAIYCLDDTSCLGNSSNWLTENITLFTDVVYGCVAATPVPMVTPFPAANVTTSFSTSSPSVNLTSSASSASSGGVYQSTPFPLCAALHHSPSRPTQK